jgi:hypothetical protein
MSRIDINRLLRRVDALESRRMPKRAPRIFRMIVEANAEMARFRADNGVADDDMLIARIVVPHDMRLGETASEAYQRELATQQGVGYWLALCRRFDLAYGEPVGLSRSKSDLID